MAVHTPVPTSTPAVAFGVTGWLRNTDGTSSDLLSFDITDGHDTNGRDGPAVEQNRSSWTPFAIFVPIPTASGPWTLALHVTNGGSTVDLDDLRFLAYSADPAACAD